MTSGISASVYDFSVLAMDGSMTPLERYRGKVLLIVNTASHCGFTPQYAGLEALYQRFQPRGLEILGFPCNQFGGQEPGSAAQIASFCETRYGVTFPLFAKIEVNGAGADPLYQFLKREQRGLLGGEAIRWNFTKFLVDRRGRVIRRFGSASRPAGLAKRIEALLDEAV